MKNKKKTKEITRNKREKPIKLFAARFTGLWRSYKMPETMSKTRYQRLKGAYLGYNSFDGIAMEYWPEARWGNQNKHFFPHSFFYQTVFCL